MSKTWCEIRNKILFKGLLLKFFEMVLLVACTCIHLEAAESMRVPLATKTFPIVSYCSFILVTFICILTKKGMLPKILELILHSLGSILTAGSGGIVFNMWLCKASHKTDNSHPLLLVQSLLSFLVAIFFFIEFTYVLVNRHQFIDERNTNTMTIERRSTCRTV